MIFPDSPEAHREIEHQLDPNDPILLESDSNRVVGDLSDLARVMLRSINAMSPAEKQSVRDALNEQMPTGSFTADDIAFLRTIGSNV
jgi:hypothetical protein